MRRLVFLLVFVAVLWPSAAAAENGDTDSTLVRINSDAVIPAGDTIGTVVVINGDAIIEGTVLNSVVVINGDASVSGTIEGGVTVVSGDIRLLDGSTVIDVDSIRGDILRDAGATVTGDVNERSFSGLWAVLGVFSVLLWVGLTVALLVAGVVFALVGSRQLTAASRLMTGDAVAAIIGSVLVWVALPILAAIAIVTIIGLPLGLGVLVFLLPALGFLGYFVAATRLGMFLVGALKQQETEKPVLAAILGILLFQIVLFVPIFGFFVVFLASIWGAGSLASIAYRSVRGQGAGPAAPEPALAD